MLRRLAFGEEEAARQLVKDSGLKPLASELERGFRLEGFAISHGLKNHSPVV